MKKLLTSILAILIAVFALSCEEKECCANQEEGANLVSGQWLLFERGYSPGAGYIIEPVSNVPPQVIEFKRDGTFSSSVSGLSDYKFYSVEDDVVGLFTKDPGPAPDSSAFTHSYNFTFENGNLKLSFRYCFEGCHMTFKKIE